MAKTSVKRSDKKEGHRPGGHSLNPERKISNVKKGIAKPRDAGTIKRLQMYRNFRAKRDKRGKIIKAAPFQSYVDSGTRARVEPARGWFSNTKVIGQSALQKFQDEMGKTLKDPYKVVMNPTKLPVTLLQEKAKYARVHMLDTEPFTATFGKKATRKKPNMKAPDLATLVSAAEAAGDNYDGEKDKDRVTEEPDSWAAPREYIFSAGQSRRIWSELYKVIDSSDVIVNVLDARDPLGTRCPPIEAYMKKEKQHKHLMFVLNKVDLVPTWVTQKWVATLSQEYPTIAFHASIKHPFGKGALINLFRQMSKLHQTSKQISVGFIGYPNTGKSSIINALRAKKVCNVAPIAGETKVWQYITLMKKVYLIDCPGVVHPSGETDEEKVLKGVVRVELVAAPEDYIPAVMQRVKTKYLERTYKVSGWTSSTDFLEKLAKKSGKLVKGGEPDINTVAKMVLNDWQRGKLPFFVPPPGCELEPRPEDLEEEEEEQEEDEENDKEEVEEEEEELASDAEEEEDSDNDTVITNDTVATNDTTDSLYEDARHPKEVEMELVKKVGKKKVRVPQNLQDLVKQDFKKIVTSVIYEDEDKYLGGKKVKKTRKTASDCNEEKQTKDAGEEKEVPETSEPKNDAKETQEKSDTAVSKVDVPPKTAGEVTEKKKDVSEEVVKRKDAPEEDAPESVSSKKVKTGCGTFTISSADT